MFEEEIAVITYEWAKDVADNIRNRWNNSQGVTGNAEVSVDAPAISSGNIMTAIVAEGQKAWILEYGSGSKSDTQDNPYIDSYVNDSNFNRYRSRSDMRIRGRNAGEYKDLDGNTHESTGKNAGKDLEIKPVYEPQIPLKIIHEEIQKELPELRSRISLVIPKLIAKALKIDVGVIKL